MVSCDKAKAVVQLSYTDEFDITDLENRKLYLNGEVNDSVIETQAYHIMRYNREDKGKPVEERKPIYLYINSPGGEVVNGYGLIDAILNSKTPVYTVNLAQCASMGFLIFLAGTKRYAMSHAEFLMHDGSTFSWDSTAKAKDRMEFETVQLEEMTRKYIMSRTTIDEKLYDEKYRVEWYMLPEEAKSHQICTHIVGTDCEMDEIL